jgi:hypothetical protein
LGQSFIAVHTGPNKYAVGTLLTGLIHGHGGMDAEFPGFVTCGRDNASTGKPAHNHTFSGKIGIVQLLNRSKICIHVDVKNQFI